ncbi:MAG TPA: hypothetical protein VGE29_12175 [Prosthecobacter sp.]
MLMQISTWISALLMALPMCWCCLVTALPAAPASAADEAACPACHAAAHGGESLPESEKSGSPVLPCCLEAGTTRTLFPALAMAPQPVLVDLQMTAWEPAESLRRLAWFQETSFLHGLRQAQAPPPGERPLYHRHCALLI